MKFASNAIRYLVMAVILSLAVLPVSNSHASNSFNGHESSANIENEHLDIIHFDDFSKEQDYRGKDLQAPKASQDSDCETSIGSCCYSFCSIDIMNLSLDITDLVHRDTFTISLLPYINSGELANPHRPPNS